MALVERVRVEDLDSRLPRFLEGAWSVDKVVEIKIDGVEKNIKEVEVSVREPDDEEYPRLVFEVQPRPTMINSLVYVEMKFPRPYTDLKQAAKQVLRFVEDFTDEEGIMHDGFGAAEAFVDLCMKLYGVYTTRGVKARIEDTGGDYPTISVDIEYLG